jgi:copper chaperone CopZ
MMQSFEVLNVRCGGCVSMLVSRLKDDFGKVSVDMSVAPAIITLDIDDSSIERLRRTLRVIGYPMVNDELNRFQNVKTKIKGLVACAVGRFS